MGGRSAPGRPERAWAAGARLGGRSAAADEQHATEDDVGDSELVGDDEVSPSRAPTNAAAYGTLSSSSAQATRNGRPVLRR
jgi:hypothetical protein